MNSYVSSEVELEHTKISDGMGELDGRTPNYRIPATVMGVKLITDLQN
jgi:hypothetical protein